MSFCGKCGGDVLSSLRYWRSFGTALLHESDALPRRDAGPLHRVGEGAGEAVTTGATPQTLPYHISLTRVLIMGVLSHGSYLIYWFYLTWKQYREHTRTEAYPVWHALTLFVPIYSLFRTHAHVRAFKELMLNAGLSTNLSVGGAVLLMFVYWLVSIIGLADAWRSGGFSGESAQGPALVSTVTGLISIAIVTWFVVHVQGSLNQYWASLKNVKAVNTNIGKGEVLFALLGLLSWGLTVANLASPAV